MVTWQDSGESVSSRALLTGAVVWAGGVLLVNGLLYRGPARRALDGLERSTHGFLEPTLFGSLVVLGIFLVFLRRTSKLSIRDLGWAREALLPSVGSVLAFWLLLQALLALWLGISARTLELHAGWREPGAMALLGGLLAQLFGNALAEETAFRGFFFVQLLRRWSGVQARWRRISLAALASAALFALTHLPNRLLLQKVETGALLRDQLQLILAGCLFALVLLATRNLFTTTGLHALANDPATLLQATRAEISQIYLALLLAWIVGYGIRTRLRRRGEPEVSLRAESGSESG